MELISWLASQTLKVPQRSDSPLKKLHLTPTMLELPQVMTTDRVRAAQANRSPGGGAVWIEHAILTAEREGFRALGLVFLAYALSEQAEPFRLMLPGGADELSQLIVWPSQASELEAGLGFRQRIYDISYKARLPHANPNYLTFEQRRKWYHREHLPYCRLGSAHVEAGGVTLPNEPVCLHFQGTAPSLVWFGKYLLDFALEDCNATLAYLYNATPGKSMAPNSAELRLTVGDPALGVRLLPSRTTTDA